MAPSTAPAFILTVVQTIVRVTRSSQIPDTTDILIPEHASSRGEESTSGTDEDGSIITVAAQEEQFWLTLHHMYDDYTALWALTLVFSP